MRSIVSENNKEWYVVSDSHRFIVNETFIPNLKASNFYEEHRDKLPQPQP